MLHLHLQRGWNHLNENTAACGAKCGFLPNCAPLAAAFVPKQQSANPQYEAKEALARGTLFPGLDLPFMNMVNTPEKLSTPLAELMAIDFVCKEMLLYLDTHADDKEAFELYKKVLKLADEAHKRYTARYGPVVPKDMVDAQSFTWINDPWPWDYTERSMR